MTGTRSEPNVESGWLSALDLGHFVSLDLETTGLDPETDQIIEVGAVRFCGGSPVERFESFVNLDAPLPPFITELTGITSKDLSGAPSLASVTGDLLDFIKGEPLVGQNPDFDLGFLRVAGEEITKGRRSNPFALTGIPVLDTGFLARVFWPELPSFGLENLARTFDVPIQRSHRAADDACTTGLLLRSIIQRLPDRVWHSLATDLARLIDATAYRGRDFFRSLCALTKNIAKPSGTIRNDREERCAGDDVQLAVQMLLGTGGIFERRLPFFQSRNTQIELAESVITALDSGRILMGEAPTGVGKSLAYLVPALKWIASNPESARQVIVSSHTRVLQDQLQRKDIRDLRTAIGDGFRTAVLKGRNNYLCLRRLRRLLREADERLSDWDRIHLMPVLRWAEVTETGDVSEISGFNPRRYPHLWMQISSDSLACAGSLCSASKGDFHRAAQEHAAKAQIVFVNHALLASDWNRLTAGEDRRLIIDEAHQVERAIVGAMTRELSASVIRSALSRFIDERSPRGLLSSAALPDDQKLELERQARALYGTTRACFAALSETLAASLSANERSAKLRYGYGDRIHGAILHALAPLKEEWNRFASSVRALLRGLSDLRGEDRPPMDLLTELRSAADLADELSQRLDYVMSTDDPGWVRWIEFGKMNQSAWSSVFAAPISVTEMMGKTIWPSVGGALLTSATLSAGGSFDVVRDALGLNDPESRNRVGVLAVGSPFDLPHQMRIFVPSYLPDPRQNDGTHTSAVCDLVRDIVRQFPRGTLVLATSNEFVDRLTDSLSSLVASSGRTLLSQSSSGSLAELVEKFRQSGNAVMIGAASFWEGIDVVGDALQILIVTRIPFDVPTEPWIAARCDAIRQQGRDPFAEYSLPVATLRLRQGIGRLIRHPQDRGIAVIADPRLFTARYGHIIRTSMPVPVMRAAAGSELLDQMEAFWSGNA